MRAPPERPPHRILLVDDDPDVHEIVSMALGAVGGYDVDVCLSGEEAVRRVRKAPPELILLDVMMPGQDGLETLRVLKSRGNTSGVPVVMLTAATTEGDRSLPVTPERVRRKSRA